MATPKLKQLYLSLCIGAACIALGIIAIWAAQTKLDTMREKHEKVVRDQKAANTRLARLSVESAEIDLRVAQYLKLVKSGMVGDEQRLEWAETLHSLSVANPGMDLHYTLAVQQPLDYAGLAATEHAVPRSSQIKVDAQLLHEVQLFELLERLRTLPGYFSVRSCAMERSATPNFNQPKATLKASCIIDLITIAKVAPEQNL